MNPTRQAGFLAITAVIVGVGIFLINDHYKSAPKEFNMVIPVRPTVVPVQPKKYTPEQLDGIKVKALEYLNSCGFHRVSDLSVWLGDDNAETIVVMKVELDKTRKWANSIHDPDVARAYNDWLDFYAKGIDEGESELKTHALRDRQDAFQKEISKSDSNVANVDIPRPPCCSR